MSVAIELEVARTWISVCPVAEGSPFPLQSLQQSCKD